MTLGKRHSLPLGVVLGACLLAGSPASVTAESACKGLEQTNCTSTADCTWVGGYTRGNGTKVSGYCRVKSGGGKKTKASSPPKEGSAS